MINVNENDWINPHHKKYYEMSNTLEKYKEWTPIDMMEIYKKRLKKSLVNPVANLDEQIKYIT